MANQSDGAKRAHSASKKPSLLRRVTQALPHFLAGAADPKEVSFRRLMSGEMSKLPERSTKTVRLFISSTFSDMHLERNVLMNKVYPRLKEFCREEYGFEFQIVDMRWGIQEGTSLDQLAAEMCYSEIENCLRLSHGPFFLAILSHRYGARQPPHAITQEEMSVLLNKINTEIKNLMQKWYILDDNQLPPQYILQPVADPESSESEIQDALACWRSEEATMLSALAAASNQAHKEGVFEEKQLLRFTASVTHQELQRGLVECPQHRRQDALLFSRKIVDIRQQLVNTDALRFIDTTADGQVDETIFLILQQLQNKSLTQLLPERNSKFYEIQWKQLQLDGINDYEQKLEEDFDLQLRRLISQAASTRSELEANTLYAEVLQHSHHCSAYVQQFQGRTDVMQKLKHYITGDSCTPLVIFGGSGCGKTSVLAKAGVLARDWLPEQQRSSALLLIRFLGTSPESSTIRQTLRSLCNQLAVFLGQAETEMLQYIDDFRDLVDAFYGLVELLGSSHKVVVILDSLDQLQAADAALHATWLRRQLPENMKLIVSTLPDMYDILNTCRKLLQDEAEHFIEVMPLQPHVCDEIVRTMLLSRGRCLTQQQQQLLTNAFAECSTPLYVTLLCNQAAQWRSYAQPQALAVEHSVRGAIAQLFRSLQRRYGYALVSHSLSYITASRSGISEAELEDLLSLDEEVLSEIFSHHLPPFIRVPPLSWARIRQQIGSYLAEREADGIRVIFWYHRQFWEVAHDFLFAENITHRSATHSLMADYFLGLWAKADKPFSCPDRVRRKLEKQGQPVPTAADRRVAAQPFILQRQAGGSRRLNLRKMSELPYHLVHSGRIKEFHQHITFNLEFLEAKLTATSRHNLLQDLQLGLEVVSNDAASTDTEKKDAERVLNALRVAALSLNHSSLALAVDLCGRLHQFANDSPNIRRLLDDCHHYIDGAGLLPLTESFDSGSGYTHCTVEVQLSIGKICKNGNFFVISIRDNSITWFDLDGNEIKSVVSENAAFSLLRCVSQLPASGCCLAVLKKKKSDTQQLFRVDLNTGSWRVIMSEIPEIPDSAFSDDENVLSSTENHLLIKDSGNNNSFSFPVYVVKAEPFTVKKVEVSRKLCSFPFLMNDKFFYFIGGEGKENEHMLPKVIFLHNMEVVELQPSDNEEEEGNSFISENILSAVNESSVLILTFDSDEGEHRIFARRFDLISSDNSAKEGAYCSHAIEDLTDGGACLSADGSTAAVLGYNDNEEAYGLIINLVTGELVKLGTHPILAKSLETNFDDTDGALGSLPFRIHLSEKGDILIAKGKSSFMLNVWSTKTGQFLRAVPGANEFLFLGEPRGSGMIIINHMPEGDGNSSLVQLKVLKLQQLGSESGDYDEKCISRKHAAKGKFLYDSKTNSLVTYFFDKHVKGGLVENWNTFTGQRQVLLHTPLPEVATKMQKEASRIRGMSAKMKDLNSEDEDTSRMSRISGSQYDLIEEDDYDELSEEDDDKVSVGDLADQFGESAKQAVVNHCVYWDLKQYGIALFKGLNSTHFQLKEIASFTSEDSTDLKYDELKDADDVTFSAKHSKGSEANDENKILTKKKIAHSLAESLSKQTEFLILNHPAVSVFPIGYYISGEEHEQISRNDSSQPCILSHDKKHMHVLHELSRTTAHNADKFSSSTSEPDLDVVSPHSQDDAEGSDGNHSPQSLENAGASDGNHSPQLQDNAEGSDGNHSPQLQDNAEGSDGNHSPQLQDNAEGSDGNHSSQLQDDAEGSDGSHYIVTVGLTDRSLNNWLKLPNLTVGESFLGIARRAAMIEFLQQKDQELQREEVSLSIAAQNETGIEAKKAAVQLKKEYLRKKLAECQANQRLDEDLKQLTQEMDEWLKKKLGSGYNEDEFDIESLVDIFESFEMEIDADNECQPIAIFTQPGQAQHAIVQYRIASIADYSDAFSVNCMSWPTRLVICDLSAYSVLSVSDTFDGGILQLLPDGANCISCRLKVFSISDGCLVRDLDPSNSIVLIDMMLTSDGEVLVGKRFEPPRKMQLLAGDDSSADSFDEFDDPPKVVQAYSLIDGSLIFNYLFEAEPFLSLMPSSNRLMLLLRDHPVQIYEILKRDKSRSAAQLPNSPPLQQANTPVHRNNYLQSVYFNEIREALSKSMAAVADARPADPIAFVAQNLLQIAGKC